MAQYNNYQQYEQPPYYQPKQSNTNKILVAVIIFLLALIVAGGGFYFYSQNKKQQAKIERMKKEQREMEEKNEALVEKNKDLKEENAKKPKVVEKVVERRVETVAPSSSAKPVVVINGVGVRLRFGPGTDYGYLTWANGQTRAPKKGSRLEYISETTGWYRVKYLGQEFYVSKDFSYLDY